MDIKIDEMNDLERQYEEVQDKLEYGLLRDLTDEEIRTLHAYESWQDGLNDWEQVKSLWKDEGLDRTARINQLVSKSRGEPDNILLRASLRTMY
jgi:hypothetical protein